MSRIALLSLVVAALCAACGEPTPSDDDLVEAMAALERGLPEERTRAASVLAEAGESAIPLLEARLLAADERDAEVREAGSPLDGRFHAAQALGAIGPPAIPALLRVLGGPSEPARIEAQHVLLGLSIEGPHAVELGALAGAEDLRVAGRAGELLATLPAETFALAVEPLASSLNPRVRTRAVHAYARRTDAAGREGVFRLLADEDARIRAECAAQLVAIAEAAPMDASDVERWLDAFAAETDESVLAWHVTGMTVLGPRVVPLLASRWAADPKAALGERIPAVLVALVAYDEAARELLDRVAHSPNARTRIEAQLGRVRLLEAARMRGEAWLGPNEAEELALAAGAAILRELHDPNDAVRAMALAALAEIPETSAATATAIAEVLRAAPSPTLAKVAIETADALVFPARRDLAPTIAAFESSADPVVADRAHTFRTRLEEEIAAQADGSGGGR